ncbi:uncharacterized protein LOC132272971 [Cornus florida]|uniref:uncharacterized protein LOC132272971 n=1 Tax=Cornus florida TaxID=4283 RepID=UPI00289CE45E|nr:uncharacterized protein LOC132272971 [Cornus florida]
MRVILSKPNLSGRITKWAIELSFFDISYEPKVSHKGQALADFLLEYEDKPKEPGPSELQWELRVDEYEALLAGLQLVSQLQVTSQYQPKEDRMKAYREAVENTSRGFDQIEFHQVPREENSEADQLVAAASSLDEDLVDPLEAYLKEGTLPNQEAEARKLRLTAAKYAIINNQLYRKSFSNPYLKCLSPTEALTILNRFMMGIVAITILNRFKVNPWPFAQWGIDIVGHLPKTVEKKEYVLLATDYFTKWVEAEAYISVTYEQVKSFLWNNIICRFGVSNVIMMDNGPNLDNRNTRKFFAKHGIRQKLATVSHPQGNGQAEITNRTIFSCLKKKLEKLKSKWYENLPQVLWAY